MRPALIISALVLPIAACDSGPTVTATNATPAEVHEKVAAASGNGGVMVNPGRWEGTMTMEEMNIPNMPPQAKEQMKAQMGEAKSFVNCVTEEDVRAQKAFFTGGDNDKNCKYDRFAMTGGKLDAAMTCDQPGGAKMNMTMNGNYSADTYGMKIASRAQGGGSPMGEMSMVMSIAAKRVGACKGTQDEL